MKKNLLLFTALFFAFIACRKGDVIPPTVETTLQTPEPNSPLKGFYLLNEGAMGKNKASIDFLSITTGIYYENIYSTANPTAVKELGDVGSDLQVYGGKLYAVLNGSNKVEVMDVNTGKKIGQVDIANGRYIQFHNGKAYVSSYVGADYTTPDIKGSVIEFDTLDLTIKRQVTVGYQPEEIAIVNNKLYVANSGGYKSPLYDSTVSVIDLTTFKEIKKIDVAINLSRMKADKEGNLFVISKGNYSSLPSRLSVINTSTDTYIDMIDIRIENFCISGDSLYFYSTEWSDITNSMTVSYGIVNTKTRKLISNKIVHDNTADQIIAPYGISINPVTHEIYIADALSYSGSGKLYCFTPQGIKKWETITGDIPGQIAFVWK